MKSILAIVSVLSMAAAANALVLPPIIQRQTACRIFNPAFLQTTEAVLPTLTTFDFEPETDFLIEGSDNPVADHITLAAFDIPFDGNAGPCDIKFFFLTAASFDDITALGSTINVRTLPDGSTNLKDAFLLGTVNFKSNDVYPKLVEVNSIACPNSGELFLAFETLAGEAVKFDQFYGNGLFVFKGDCFGIPFTF